jgi:hypothetical protein
MVRSLRDLDACSEKIKNEAIYWWFCKERKWIFSAYHCCHYLNIDLQQLRDFILYNWPEVREKSGCTPKGPRRDYQYAIPARLEQMIDTDELNKGIDKRKALSIKLFRLRDSKY